MSTAQASQSVCGLLRAIGTPAELRAAAEHAPAPPSHVNSHIHLPPNFSAFDTVAQAMDLAQAQGITVLGTSNYYDYNVYEVFAAEAAQRGIFPLFGLETIVLVDNLAKAGLYVNDPGVPGKMYLCGKGITRLAGLAPEARRVFDTLRDGDAARIAKQAAIIAERFVAAGLPTALDASAIAARVAKRHGCPPETVFLQERHVVQAYQEVLFDKTQDIAERVRVLEAVCGAPVGVSPENAVAVQGALRSHLMKDGKPAFVEGSLIGFEDGYRLILAMGGIPCYPILLDGASPISAFESDPAELAANLKARGVHCVELIPIRNEVNLLRSHVEALRAAGLSVTAGTEHNTLDLIPMEPTCLGGAPIPEALEAIFREGACVAAAHQFLAAHGEPGFVDANGVPHPGFADDNARITAFARLGAAVIQRYRETNS